MTAEYTGTLVSQVAIDLIQHLTAQMVLFQQMTEAQDGGLVGCRSHAQIDSDEAPQRGYERRSENRPHCAAAAA
jgi:hypothetical protein